MDSKENRFINISNVHLEMPPQNRRIRGRVVAKCSLKTFTAKTVDLQESGEKNGLRSEILFCFILRDTSGEIEITAFASEANRFKNTIIRNEFYEIDDFEIVPKDDEYSVANHVCRLRVDENSLVTHHDDLKFQASVPKFEFPSTPINMIKDDGNIVNILGVCVGSDEIETKQVSRGSDFPEFRLESFRRIWLADQSNMKVQVALWAFEARDFNPDGYPIVYLYGGLYPNRFTEIRNEWSTMMLVSPLFYINRLKIL
jgi:hypothetical protein